MARQFEGPKSALLRSFERAAMRQAHQEQTSSWKQSHTLDHINSILKDCWYDLSVNEKDTWKQWDVWDAKGYEHQLKIYESQSKSKKSKEMDSSDTNTAKNEGPTTLHIPKRNVFSIPKKH